MKIEIDTENIKLDEAEIILKVLMKKFNFSTNTESFSACFALNSDKKIFLC